MGLPTDLKTRLALFEERAATISTIKELAIAICEEVRAATSYQSAWVAVFEPRLQMVRVRGVIGPIAPQAELFASMIPMVGDPYMQRIYETGETQIVEDGQTDPNVNRGIVEQLGNRTIVNVPISSFDQRLGAIGVGTFGDEGVRLPTETELTYVQSLAEQVARISSRLDVHEHDEAVAAQAAALDARDGAG